MPILFFVFQRHMSSEFIGRAMNKEDALGHLPNVCTTAVTIATNFIQLMHVHIVFHPMRHQWCPGASTGHSARFQLEWTMTLPTTPGAWGGYFAARGTPQAATLVVPQYLFGGQWPSQRGPTGPSCCRANANGYDNEVTGWSRPKHSGVPICPLMAVVIAAVAAMAVAVQCACMPLV